MELSVKKRLIVSHYLRMFVTYIECFGQRDLGYPEQKELQYLMYEGGYQACLKIR